MKIKIIYILIIFVELSNFAAINEELNLNTKDGIKTDTTSQSVYYGGWPTNPFKDNIKGSNLNFICPKEIGCECSNNSDCINSNCKKSPRG